MQTPSFKEDHISQIPALQLLQNLGYTYLSPEEALELRGGKTTAVLLESILKTQLEKINSISYKGGQYTFSAQNVNAGLQALKDLPMNEGYMAACEYAYNLLTLGKALEQSIDGDKKSFTLQYIDWNPQTFLTNNVFHVTEEYSIMRSASKEHYRPDLVLFVNGIPLCVIECKRPDIKDSLTQAISQHLRSQQEEGIRSLYVYTQLLLSVSVNDARYATNATQEKFWSQWQEQFVNADSQKQYQTSLLTLKNTPLTAVNKDKLFSGRYKYVRRHFDDIEKEHVLCTKQDEYLYSLCRPERLLELTHNFILFDDGEKKIARYPQFFVLKKTMERIRVIEAGKRRGGVIWHTQGSGKSLTMVLLAQAIALEKSISNPKIILVTDRVELDDQITKTFIKCGKYVENATTGQRLVELLESKKDAIVTTVINKFEAAIKKIKKPFESHDIFVLIDEGHRTQYGNFSIQMQKTLPNACFIAMTGTPLLKQEKNTAAKFGGIIDAYPVDKAVNDGAVVPLLYEGRHAFQTVNEKPIDTFFQMVAEPLTEYQRADLKRKFSRADQLNIADQKIYAIAWDISHHFRDNWQGKTPFKGQLVTQSKEAAIKYKKYLDEIGIVSSEVLISAPDDREGEDSAYSESSDLTKQFWNKMMAEHGTPKKYEKNLINRFKKQPNPEIIIVVDKLLTGFDEPKNTILYLTRNLKSHTLLQAIARVNRVHEDKDFGYIIDYYGVLGELDEALTHYSSLQEFDEQDLMGALTNVNDEVKKLPQRHSELWDIFKAISNRKDAEAYQQLLRDEAIRAQFYDKLSAFAGNLKVAMSSIQFHKDVPEKTIEKYKTDLAMFLKLRNAVQTRYSDSVNYKQYEGQVQKLIDKHIQTDEVKPITALVNIFDKDKFRIEVEKTIGEAAKADKIASRTAKHISDKMDEDPAFYKKFSEMLNDTIHAYEHHRLTEAQYLARVKEIMESVLSHIDNDIPSELQNKDVAKAFYGLTDVNLKENVQDALTRRKISVDTALTIDDIIQKHVFDKGKPIIDWQYKSNITGKLQIEIGDYLIDEVRDKYHVNISFDEMDTLAERCIEVAKIRYK